MTRYITFTDPQPGDVPWWEGGAADRPGIGIFRGGIPVACWTGTATASSNRAKTRFTPSAANPATYRWWAIGLMPGPSTSAFSGKGGIWMLDANGNGTFDGTGPGKDLMFRI